MVSLGEILSFGLESNVAGRRTKGRRTGDDFNSTDDGRGTLVQVKSPLLIGLISLTRNNKECTNSSKWMYPKAF